MKHKSERVLSRREFAQRAAMLSATASLVPAGVILPPDAATFAQEPKTAPNLSDAGQAEAESRYQQILSLYSNRLDDEQKAHVRKMCADLQPMLDRIRAYPLANGDAPALYLKPMVERPKKPQAAPKSQPGATAQKP
jgi:hypothetical protein